MDDESTDYKSRTCDIRRRGEPSERSESLARAEAMAILSDVDRPDTDTVEVFRLDRYSSGGEFRQKGWASHTWASSSLASVKSRAAILPLTWSPFWSRTRPILITVGPGTFGLLLLIASGKASNECSPPRLNGIRALVSAPKPLSRHSPPAGGSVSPGYREIGFLLP
jgi:hypothetical protein